MASNDRRKSEIIGEGLSQPEGRSGVAFLGSGSELGGLVSAESSRNVVRSDASASQQSSDILNTLNGFPCYIIE